LILDQMFHMGMSLVAFLVNLLPSAPIFDVQWTAIFSTFVYVNMVVDLPAILAVAVTLVSLIGQLMLFRFCWWCLDLIKGWI